MSEISVPLPRTVVILLCDKTLPRPLALLKLKNVSPSPNSRSPLPDKMLRSFPAESLFPEFLPNSLPFNQDAKEKIYPVLHPSPELVGVSSVSSVSPWWDLPCLSPTTYHLSPAS